MVAPTAIALVQSSPAARAVVRAGAIAKRERLEPDEAHIRRQRERRQSTKELGGLTWVAPFSAAELLSVSIWTFFWARAPTPNATTAAAVGRL